MLQILYLETGATSRKELVLYVQGICALLQAIHYGENKGMKEETLLNPQASNILLIAIARRLESIEKKLEKKVPSLSIEEAISAFKEHLAKGINKRGRYFTEDSRNSYDYIISKFEEHFAGKNVDLILPEECQEFLSKYWGKSGNGCYRQRQTQLRIFFTQCNAYLKKKGRPVFQNPCDPDILEKIAYTPKQPEWFPVEQMKAFLDSARREHHYLAFSILATSGIRINDLMNLRKCDIEGRVLRLRTHDFYRPKSGRDEEVAVIPEIIAGRLASWLADKPDTDNIMPVTEIAISKAIASHGEKIGLKLNPHVLRKWIASYWERKKEEGMVRFVLRHSSSDLRGRYIAPLTIEEVIEKQKILEKELFLHFHEHQ
jgi:integrase